MTISHATINITSMKSSKKPDYRLVDHTADLGIMVRGEDLKDLFENAALSLIHIIMGKIPEGKGESLQVDIQGEDMVDLMVNWLSEILYLFEGEKKILNWVEITSLSSKNISAMLQLIPYDERAFDIQCEIKAVTYHQLKISKNNKHWQATIIFDV